MAPWGTPARGGAAFAEIPPFRDESKRKPTPLAVPWNVACSARVLAVDSGTDSSRKVALTPFPVLSLDDGHPESILPHIQAGDGVRRYRQNH
jgi:hypothetical protein